MRRAAEVAKLVLGSCFIYLVVGACAAAYDEQGKTPPGSSGDPSPSASTPTPSPTNPIPNAMADGFRSGSRLKLRFYEGEDGARQFINFFDTKYQTNCEVGGAYGRTSDGKLRCLPMQLGQIYFSDAQCKVPTIYLVSKTQVDQPKIAAVIVYGASGYYQDHYALTGLVNPPASGYVHSENGAGGGGSGCSTNPQTIQGGQNYYGVGAPLAPTEFVEMTPKNE